MASRFLIAAPLSVVVIAAAVYVARQVSDPDILAVTQGIADTSLPAEAAKERHEPQSVPHSDSGRMRQSAEDESELELAANWVDPSAMSPLFGRRMDTLDVPLGILDASAYSACTVLNPTEEPLTESERFKLERILESARTEFSRLHQRATASRHESIESRIVQFDEGLVLGSPEAQELQRQYKAGEVTGFLAFFHSGTGDPADSRVLLASKGDDMFVDGCFDDLWASAEMSYGDIAQFFSKRLAD